jgi:predicted acylesterase/phospholipase RssA
MSRCLLHSGGAAYGAVGVYTLRKLVEHYGYDSYGAVVGVSVGASNGIKFAQHDLDGLEALWRSVDGRGWFQKIDPLHLSRGLYTFNPLRERMQTELVKLGGTKSIKIPLHFGVTDLQRKRYKQVPHTVAGDSVSELVSIAIASSAQPTIHHVERCLVAPGVRRTCADGGVVHVIPLPPEPPKQVRGDPAGKWDAIDVILCSQVDRRDPAAADKVDGALESGFRAIEMWNDRTVLSDISFLKQYAAETGTQVTLYSPPEDPGEPFDAEPDTIAWRLDVLGPKVWALPRAL